MLEQDALIQSLDTSVLFKDVSAEEVERIITFAHWRTVEQGQYVYRQGDNDCHFYIVAHGEAELTMNVAGGEQFLIGHIGPGGHFGETALLTNSSNSLNARALTSLSLLCFDADTFNSVLLANHIIQRQLSIALARRLRFSFHDHAKALTRAKSNRKSSEHSLDPTFLSGPTFSAETAKLSMARGLEDQPTESTIARQIMTAVRRFSSTLDPVLITGETGTGRRMAAYEIHQASAYRSGPYLEVDIRNFDSGQLEVELFGYERDSFAFSQIDQLGAFERLQDGTVVLYNAENMEPDFQRQLVSIIKKGFFSKVAGDSKVALRSRLILICKDTPRLQDGHNRLLPSLYALVANQHFRMTPLRGHRRDIPRLVQYYLKRYSLQYGKTINQVDDQTLGKFMNYDWPGNLTEMASVLQRAVILGSNNEPLSSQILLGVPRSEGKWEFNLLRLHGIRTFITGRLFPELPRALVGVGLTLVLIALFFGPANAEKNIGLTLSWVVGWPLLIFSFFFLARTWCSVCGLSVPGWLAQTVFRPERPTPQFIRKYSGWIMTLLCILLFWIETTWNAYKSPHLTAWIISIITLSSLFFSMFFKRRVWCRYLCPLGAINAIFAMPSILELRSNTHMCMNRCSDHVCYTGDDGAAGCPMFRHPFLVDNNRDCILCGQCIKNCKLDSIHLNLRLAPQELWNLQSPRLEDSFLVVSLAAIFYPFAINQKYPGFVESWSETLHAIGLPHSPALASSIFFFGCIIIYLSGYAMMSQIMARITGNSWKATASILGYGMIPLVLGAFMAAHLEIFVGSLQLLPANILDIIGIGGDYGSNRIMNRDATFVLQAITVFGGLIAALYASQRIIKRLLIARQYSLKMFAVSAFLLCLSAVAYLWLV
ncbi:MAG: sigma 54-interacting transcriptional regulator [Desulfoprunum sp.]|nr:sigma 54-interacting transcriptional regulator [Desulfoprunum sp.]